MPAKKKAKGTKKKVDIVKAIAKELLKLMGTKAKTKVTQDKEEEVVVVDLKTEDEAGLLIGSRGDTLNSIQAIIGMIYRQRTGEWVRISVNVADWRERQAERLKELALQAAQRARETGEAQTLYNLSPSQRRTIHMILAEEKDIQTESQGEGGGRYLVVNTK